MNTTPTPQSEAENQSNTPETTPVETTPPAGALDSSSALESPAEPVAPAVPVVSSEASEGGEPSSTTVPPTPTPAVMTVKAGEFGRIDEAGNVYVKDGESERLIGGYPDGVPEHPFDIYQRRYADLEATIKLFEDRLPSLAPKEIDQTLKTLRTAVVEPAAIGDLQALRNRVERLAERAEERKVQAATERKAAKEKALKERTELVEKAEKLVAQDPEKIHWKNSGQTLRDLLEQWKAQQRRGPRLDKKTEDQLWKRFASARASFDKSRRHYFSALDQSQNEAKAIKEGLIKEAEELQNSTEWAETSRAYRSLMDRWKAAPRASRKEDDALWARFRGAQQVFYEARRAKDEAADAEFKDNLDAKEVLLKEAEALLPVKNIAQTKEKLRNIQDRWEEIGRVPSSALSRVEARMRAVETAVRNSEEQEWKRSNPETKERGQSMLAQLEAQIERLENDIRVAEETGDSKKISDLNDTLTTKKAWLEQIRASMG